MNIDFNQFPWHDATLLELIVSRRSPGRADTVDMVVRTPEGRVLRLSFEQCYGFECAMNFGVIAAETIRGGACCDDSEELRRLLGRWASVGVRLEGIRQYELTTNSTDSVLRVFARNMTTQDDEASQLSE